MDHRNVVLEIFLSDIGDVMLVENLFRPIRVINRTTSQPIWTPTCEDIGHIVKSTSFGPPKKNPHILHTRKVRKQMMNTQQCCCNCWFWAKANFAVAIQFYFWLSKLEIKNLCLELVLVGFVGHKKVQTHLLISFTWSRCTMVCSTMVTLRTPVRGVL